MTSAGVGGWCRRRDVCRRLSSVAPDRVNTERWERRVWSRRHALWAIANEVLTEEVWRVCTDVSGRSVSRQHWAVGGAGSPEVRRAWRCRSVDVHDERHDRRPATWRQIRIRIAECCVFDVELQNSQIQSVIRSTAFYWRRCLSWCPDREQLATGKRSRNRLWRR